MDTLITVSENKPKSHFLSPSSNSGFLQTLTTIPASHSYFSAVSIVSSQSNTLGKFLQNRSSMYRIDIFLLFCVCGNECVCAYEEAILTHWQLHCRDRKKCLELHKVINIRCKDNFFFLFKRWCAKIWLDANIKVRNCQVLAALPAAPAHSSSTGAELRAAPQPRSHSLPQEQAQLLTLQLDCF